ncbi:MAG: stage III sporulation protein AB [Acutalibacteraceae bacterium]|nr:stage III sporulation protein AB [Acutalibacteraceae bacterium]
MFKYASMILILSGFLFGGMYLASLQRKKTDIINGILLMISVIETQLRYACLPVNDLIRILCGTEKLSGLRFLHLCKEKLDKNKPFPEAWKCSVEECDELCRMLGKHKDYLTGLGSDIGTTDLEGQLGCCEYYKQIFKKELAVREENSKKYSKVYPALGLMLGVSAAIIIV